MTDQELQKQQEELQKQRDHEADLQRLRGFRPIDDTFMRCIYQDNIPLAEMTLRIITGIDDLVLAKGETQKDFKRLLGARSICLDYHGVDTKGKEYDLEVQKADTGARPERARYNKEDPKGVELMCKAIEEMREESFQGGVETGIQTGTEQNRL